MGANVWEFTISFSAEVLRQLRKTAMSFEEQMKGFDECVNGCESCRKKIWWPKVQISKSWLRMEGRSISRWLIHILGKLVLVVSRVPWFLAKWITSQDCWIFPKPMIQERTRQKPQWFLQPSHSHRNHTLFFSQYPIGYTSQAYSKWEWTTQDCKYGK